MTCSHPPLPPLFDPVTGALNTSLCWSCSQFIIKELDRCTADELHNFLSIQQIAYLAPKLRSIGMDGHHFLRLDHDEICSFMSSNGFKARDSVGLIATLRHYRSLFPYGTFPRQLMSSPSRLIPNGDGQGYEISSFPWIRRSIDPPILPCDIVITEEEERFIRNRFSEAKPKEVHAFLKSIPWIRELVPLILERPMSGRKLICCVEHHLHPRPSSYPGFLVGSFLAGADDSQADVALRFLLICREILSEVGSGPPSSSTTQTSSSVSSTSKSSTISAASQGVDKTTRFVLDLIEYGTHVELAAFMSEVAFQGKRLAAIIMQQKVSPRQLINFDSADISALLKKSKAHTSTNVTALELFIESLREKRYPSSQFGDEAVDNHIAPKTQSPTSAIPIQSTDHSSIRYGRWCGNGRRGFWFCDCISAPFQAHRMCFLRDPSTQQCIACDAHRPLLSTLPAPSSTNVAVPLPSTITPSTLASSLSVPISATGHPATPSSALAEQPVITQLSHWKSAGYEFVTDQFSLLEIEEAIGKRDSYGGVDGSKFQLYLFVTSLVLKPTMRVPKKCRRKGLRYVCLCGQFDEYQRLELIQHVYIAHTSTSPIQCFVFGCDYRASGVHDIVNHISASHSTHLSSTATSHASLSPTDSTAELASSTRIKSPNLGSTSVTPSSTTLSTLSLETTLSPSTSYSLPSFSNRAASTTVIPSTTSTSTQLGSSISLISSQTDPTQVLGTYHPSSLSRFHSSFTINQQSTEPVDCEDDTQPPNTADMIDITAAESVRDESMSSDELRLLLHCEYVSLFNGDGKELRETERVEQPKSITRYPFIPYLIKKLRCTDQPKLLLKILKRFNFIHDLIHLDHILTRPSQSHSDELPIRCLVNILNESNHIHLQMECVTTLMFICQPGNKDCLLVAVDSGIIPTLIKFLLVTDLTIDLVQAKRRAFRSLIHLATDSLANRDAILTGGVIKALNECQIDPRLVPHTMTHLLSTLNRHQFPDSFKYTRVVPTIPIIIGKLLSIQRESIHGQILAALLNVLVNAHRSLTPSNFCNLLQSCADQQIAARLFLLLKSNHSTSPIQSLFVLPCLSYFCYGTPSLRSSVFSPSVIQRLAEFGNQGNSGCLSLMKSNVLPAMEESLATPTPMGHARQSGYSLLLLYGYANMTNRIAGHSLFRSISPHLLSVCNNIWDLPLSEKGVFSCLELAFIIFDYATQHKLFKPNVRFQSLVQSKLMAIQKDKEIPKKISERLVELLQRLNQLAKASSNDASKTSMQSSPAASILPMEVPSSSVASAAAAVVSSTSTLNHLNQLTGQSIKEEAKDVESEEEYMDDTSSVDSDDHNGCFCADPRTTSTDVLCSRSSHPKTNCNWTHLACVEGLSGEAFKRFKFGTSLFLCRECVNQPNYRHPSPEAWTCECESKYGNI